MKIKLLIVFAFLAIILAAGPASAVAQVKVVIGGRPHHRYHHYHHPYHRYHAYHRPYHRHYYHHSDRVVVNLRPHRLPHPPLPPRP